jgi:hypothetical protein
VKAIDWRRIEIPDDRMVEIIRNMTSQERVQKGLELSQFTRDRVLCHLRTQNPDWTEPQVQKDWRPRRQLCSTLPNF